MPHELPNVFLAIEFGRARRQRHKRDVARHLENFGAMPAGFDRGAGLRVLRG
jgi:hypothetical protein